MPILEDSRHERFAQNIASGMSALDAYANAGYARHGASATRLLNNAKVSARVDELKEEAASIAGYDKAFVLDLIHDIIQEAREEGQYGPAMTGAIKLGIDIGMFESKSTVNMNVKTHEERLKELE